MKTNGFEKHYDGSEEPRNLLLVNSERESVLFYGQGSDEIGGYRWKKEYDHRPTLAEVKSDIETLINEKVSEEILEGMEYEGDTVWLSSENQLNFMSSVSVPVRLKVGETAEGQPVYKTFETAESLTAFRQAVATHINSCLAAGWAEKDGVDYECFNI